MMAGARFISATCRQNAQDCMTLLRTCARYWGGEGRGFETSVCESDSSCERYVYIKAEDRSNLP
jgi:hypothetical protein